MNQGGSKKRWRDLRPLQGYQPRQRTASLSRLRREQEYTMSDEPSVHWAAGKTDTEAKVVVRVRRRVPVTVSPAHVSDRIVPAAAAFHAVRGPMYTPISEFAFFLLQA